LKKAEDYPFAGLVVEMARKRPSYKEHIEWLIKTYEMEEGMYLKD